MRHKHCLYFVCFGPFFVMFFLFFGCFLSCFLVRKCHVFVQNLCMDSAECDKAGFLIKNLGVEIWGQKWSKRALFEFSQKGVIRFCSCSVSKGPLCMVLEICAKFEVQVCVSVFFSLREPVISFLRFLHGVRDR